MVTSGFAVTCAHINIVEQPARMPLAPAALLAQWHVSYHRGTAMQLSLAILAAALAIGSYAATGDWHWLLGAGCLLIIAPYTLLAVMPLVRELSALTGSGADERVGPLVRSWGHRHAVRGFLGLLAALVFLWATT